MNFQTILIVIFNLLDAAAGSIAAPYAAFLVLQFFLPVREKRWTKPLLYAGCVLLSLHAIYVGDPVNILGILPAFLAVLLLCCGGSLLQRCSVFLIFSGFSLAFSALIDSFLLINPAVWELVGSFMQWGLLRLTVWLAVYFALRRSAPKRGYELPRNLWVLVDLLTLAPFAATLITVAMKEGGMARASLTDLLLLLVALLTSLGLLWAVAVLARQQELERATRFYEMNRLYYRNLEQEQFQVRRLRHDMANHLQTMSGLPEPELRKYLGELIRSPAMEHSCRFCENSVVNIVMASKEAAMKQNGISTEIEVSVPEGLPVQDADLCAVFANSLDNAVEACAKLPEDRRKISVRARTEKGLFVLQIRNSAGGNPVWKDGMPVTTKRNAEAHGLGIAGIREIAARYGGSTEITEKGGQFSLLVFFPLNDGKG